MIKTFCLFFLVFPWFLQSAFEEEKYESIKTFLQNYQRPITLLDIAPLQGDYSLRIAHDFDAVCVMIDNGEKVRFIYSY